MGRSLRVDVGGYVYHVLNRANGRMQIFDDERDYAAFEKVMQEAVDRVSMRLLAYCVMPNHWHLVLWPRRDGDLSAFMTWMTLTHTQRWHAHRHDTGAGHVYQGRYKSFLIDRDAYYLAVCRYVERNALRGGLTNRAEAWRWCSLWRRSRKGLSQRVPALTDWPVDRARNWRQRVNQPENQDELDSLRRCVNRGKPFGRESWVNRMAKRFGLETTIRPRGRPRKKRNKGS